MLLTISGCSAPQKEPASQPGQDPIQKPEEQEPQEPETPPDTRTASEKQAQELLEKMTLREKIGQLVMVGVSGTQADEHITSLLETYKVGGVILYGKNVESVPQLSQLLNDLKATNAAQSGIPLFLSVDEEGGRVSRLPKGIEKLPSAKTIGDTGDPAVARAAGEGVAGQLLAFGYNLDFAPDLDAPIDFSKGVIGDRAFGDDPQLVAQMGTALLTGMQETGVIACVKHFPGHGNTVDDSHQVTPVIPSTVEELENLDLIPFQRAVDSGVDMVMAAHLLVPALDPNNTASTSTKILTGLLREKMGFQGIIITDEMSMKGITSKYTVPDGAMLAIEAGADIALVAMEYQDQVDTLEGLYQAVQEGRLPESRVDVSVLRILEVKCRYGLTDTPVPQPDPAVVSAALDEFQKLLK